MRQSARAIVVKNGTLLVMRRRKEGREYYALIGGGIDAGETPEQALYREVKEETGITINNHRLVIIQQGGFGRQYIYLCDYVSGEPTLAEDSEEAKIHAGGQNLYQPMWLPIGELPRVTLLPVELKQALIKNLADGFPKEPLTLTIAA
ncbi:MAG: NUDIX domain-containing protein [Candidatus Saccharimonadales bacterium]